MENPNNWPRDPQSGSYITANPAVPIAVGVSSVFSSSSGDAGGGSGDDVAVLQRRRSMQ